MRLTVLPLLLCLLLAGPLQASLPDEHPEWFSWTDPPPEGAVSTRLQPAARVFANPEIGGAWLTALRFVHDQGLEATLLYSDAIQREYVKEWLGTNGVAHQDFQWFEAPTDTRFTGEWAPMALLDGDGKLLPVDFTYYQARPNDDAFAGRWAAALEAPVHRAPLFLANCQWAITSDGLCLVSEKVATTANKLDAMQLRHVLRAYLGCREVLYLPAPPADGLGCLDAFIRPLPSGDILLGKPDNPGLTPTVNGYRNTLKAILPEGRSVLEVPCPAPKVLSGTVWVYLSYLYFVEAPRGLLIPSYAGYDTGLAQVKALLAKEFPGRSQTILPSDGIAELRLWPSRMLGVLPAGDLSSAPQPELRCASLDPAACGLCLPGCFPSETLCADSVTNQTCVQVQGPGDQSCGVFQAKPCGNEEVCLGGQCQDQPSPCVDIPAGGRCDGDKALFCVDDNVIAVDCALQNSFCSNSGDKAHCTAACVHECLEEGSLCLNDHSVQTCQEGDLGCLVLTESLCPEGQTCSDGQCAAAPDVLEDLAPETTVQADDPPTFKRSSGGCQTSPQAPGKGGYGVLVLVLVMVMVGGRGRKAQARR